MWSGEFYIGNLFALYNGPADSVAIQLMLQHSNVDMRVGGLIYLWAVAPGHRHHHVALSQEGDVNFGLFTMLWDHCLKTFAIGRAQPTDVKLGMVGHSDYPKHYLEQLSKPFSRN